jgi:uncharacterized protein (DUF924 family)
VIDPSDITAFWRAAGPKAWFKKDAAFDAELRERFLDAHMAAARCELDRWLDTSEGALALILLLDQIPRNIFRDTAHAFATDRLARRAADTAIAAGHDLAAGADVRVFFYLPFEHAESGENQARAVALIDAIGDAELTKFARLHAGIIARFGRFPHRNAVLGRETKAEEAAFLREGGFAG